MDLNQILAIVTITFTLVIVFLLWKETPKFLSLGEKLGDIFK